MTTDTRNQALRDALIDCVRYIQSPLRLSDDCAEAKRRQFIVDDAKAALAMQEPASEPVAWRYEHPKHATRISAYRQEDDARENGWIETPLYEGWHARELPPASEPAPASARDPMIGVMASLVAAISILQRAFDEKKPPNKVIASDTMFRQMLTDYERALDVARASLKDTAPASAPSCCDYFKQRAEDALAALARASCRCGELREVARAYEQWEADLIMSKEAWGPGGMTDLPMMTQRLWDRLIEIQGMRSAALSVPSPEGDRK